MENDLPVPVPGIKYYYIRKKDNRILFSRLESPLRSPARERTLQARSFPSQSTHQFFSSQLATKAVFKCHRSGSFIHMSIFHSQRLHYFASKTPSVRHTANRKYWHLQHRTAQTNLELHHVSDLPTDAVTLLAIFLLHDIGAPYPTLVR